MISTLSEKDYDQIAELGSKLNINFKKLYNLNEIKKSKIENILVYKENNKLIGFIQYTILYEAAEIINIIVDENNRKKNIGSMLIEELKKNNIENITLEVNENNEAVNFYLKEGFEKISTRKKYYDDEDAYLMIWRKQ